MTDDETCIVYKNMVRNRDAEYLVGLERHLELRTPSAKWNPFISDKPGFPVGPMKSTDRWKAFENGQTSRQFWEPAEIDAAPLGCFTTPMVVTWPGTFGFPLISTPKKFNSLEACKIDLDHIITWKNSMF